MRPTPLVASALLCLNLAAVSPAEEKELGWFDTAELSLVLTGGNSESESLGLKNTLERIWPSASFRLEARAVRAASTDADTLAIGPDPDDFEVVEESEENVTAELFALQSGFDRSLTERLYWNLGAGWLQNRPAGIESRASLLGGLGNLWVDTPATTFKTEYGITWTREEGTLDAGADSFAGARLAALLRRKVGENGVYRNELILDENLDDTSDLRADWTNSIAVNLNGRLALKVSLQLLWDNVPSLEEIPLEFPRGTPTGEAVLVPAEDLDSYFTTSLVVNF